MSLGASESSCANTASLKVHTTLHNIQSSSKKNGRGKKENAKKQLSLAAQAATAGGLGSSLIKPVPITNSLAQNIDKNAKAALGAREFGRDMTNAAGHKTQSIVLATAPSSASGKAKQTN